MKLADLEPGFVTSNDKRVGVHFLCPKCRKQQLYIPTNDPNEKVNWKVSGELQNLTLNPSVDSRHVNGGRGTNEPRVQCHWHGWVQNGEVKPA